MSLIERIFKRVVSNSKCNTLGRWRQFSQNPYDEAQHGYHVCEIVGLSYHHGFFTFRRILRKFIDGLIGGWMLTSISPHHFLSNWFFLHSYLRSTLLSFWRNRLINRFSLRWCGLGRCIRRRFYRLLAFDATPHDGSTSKPWRVPAWLFWLSLHLWRHLLRGNLVLG